MNNFLEKLEEVIFCTIGFNHDLKKVSYYDSGSLMPKNWQLIDNCMSQFMNGSGIRFFSCNKSINFFKNKLACAKQSILKNYLGFSQNKKNK